jgi:ketosteroid isomerase-like protein
MTPWQTELLDNFNKAFNRHDVDGMMALMSEGCIFENTYPPPDGTKYQGQAAVRQFWEDFFQSSPQVHIDVEDTFVSDDRGVQTWTYRWVDEGRNAGHICGIDVFRFREDKIAEKLSYVKG